jgi:ketosteroid isomerase-like protein
MNSPRGKKARVLHALKITRERKQMRSAIALTAIIGLGLSATAFAQQEQTATPAQEQQPATTVDESATPAPAVETSPPAETKPMSSPAGKPEKMTAPTKKSVSSAPAGTTGGKKMGVEATLKDNENHWEAAYGRHDPSAAQSMVANDFSGVYWDGKVMRKSDVISQMRKDKDTYKSAMNERLDVHMYGRDVAVVIGTAREKGTTKDGKAFDRQYRFTDTWVERNGQWQCVSSHVMKTRG